LPAAIKFISGGRVKLGICVTRLILANKLGTIQAPQLKGAILEPFKQRM